MPFAANGVVDLEIYNCTAYVNGLEQEVVGTKLLGLQFGIVNYMCDDKTGTFISRLSCHNCGLFCKANELIDGCQSLIFPLTIGIIIGVLSFLIIWLLLRKCVGNLLVKSLMRMNYYRQIAADNNYKKSIDNFNKLTNSEVKYDFPNRFALSQAGSRRIYARRTAISGPMLALAVISIICNVQCDDKTLFMHSTGRVCEDNKCTESDMINLSLVTGMSVMMEDDNGQKMRVHVKNTYYRYRYSYSYDTSDYNIDIKSTWRCKSLGGMCWNSKCSHDTKFPLFENTTKIVRYGCSIDTLGCDTYCAHQTSCTWYQATINPSPITYPIYIFQSRIWEVLIEITRNGYTSKSIMNANNPILNIDYIGKNNGSIPMLVNSFLTEEFGINYNIVIVNGKAYPTDASMLNHPVIARIGDIQIDKRGKAIFPIHQLQCGSASCKAFCSLPDSPLKRLLDGIDQMNSMPIKNVVDGYIVESKMDVESTINFMLQMNGFRQIDYSPAYCTYELIDTFACKECNIKPYVILQAVNIKSKGMISISNNCSIETTLIACSPEPIHIQLEMLPDYCRIMVDRTNQTINVKFKYVYLGSVHEIRSHITYSTSDEVLGLLTSGNFLQSLVGSATSMFALGIILTLVIKLFYIYEMNHAVRNIERL